MPKRKRSKAKHDPYWVYSDVKAPLPKPDAINGNKRAEPAEKSEPVACLHASPAQDRPPKRRRAKGVKRELPCIYCLRRICNDPAWECHDQIENWRGEENYTGWRCAECCHVHGQCQFIPATAKAPVRALTVAAADYISHETFDGSKAVASLAAYEAAIGPALRAIDVPRPTPQPRPWLSNKDEKNTHKDGKKAHEGEQDAFSYPTDDEADADNEDVAGESVSGEDSEASSGGEERHFQPPQTLQPGTGDAVSLQPPVFHEDEERRDLRRRHVAALESLAHSAALFVSEFAADSRWRREQQQLQQQQVPPGPGLPRNEHGSDYAAAAAAAGMAARFFAPPEADATSDEDEEEEEEEAAAGIDDVEDDDASSSGDEEYADAPVEAEAPSRRTSVVDEDVAPPANVHRLHTQKEPSQKKSGGTPSVKEEDVEE